MLRLAAAEPAPTDVGGNVTESSKNLVEGLLESLPRIGIALIVIALTIGVALLVRRMLRKRLATYHSESYARVFSKLAHGLIMTVGLLLAVTIVFPSVAPVDLLSGLGIFSIAIGFAFQDILSNLLAGILLLIRQPFEEGDVIEVSGRSGVVQAITIRETQLKTFDGQKIVVPNAEVYQSVLRVQTAYGPKRTDLSIGLDDWEDFDRATEVILGALRSVDGVLSDPEPQVYFTHFADSTTNLDVRYWTESDQPTVRDVQNRAVRAIGAGLRDSEIPMPSPITEIDARDSLAGVLGGRAS